jgi:hypothetical protein
MGAYPGRVMTGVRDALAEHGKLPYRHLAIMLYGPDFTDADRASMARAIRQLVAKTQVISYFDAGSKIDGQYVESGMWVRRPDVEHVPAARFFDVPADGNGDRPDLSEMSRAELLAFDPSYGNRPDCQECGMSCVECFLLWDNLHSGDGSHVTYWGDGTPVYSKWNGEPTRCCFGCFHDRAASRR